MSDADTDQEPESVAVELVQPAEPGVELAERRDAAVEAAADAAMAMPGMPGRDEFLALAMQARMLSMSGAAPKEVRGNPYVAFHVAMVGRDLGISPSAALALIDVITTNNGPQLSLSPQLLNGQIRRLGLGSVRPIVQERNRCVAGAYGPDGRELGTTEFTWEDAQDAGLAGRNCQPGDHKRPNGAKCGCNQGYITYPKRMMWWRAAGFCADDYFPEAGLGLYSPEELGSVVDAEGRPLDPSQVALPPGYDDPQARQRDADNQVEQRRSAADAVAPGPELAELTMRIGALPDAQRRALAQAWKGHQVLKGYRPQQLPVKMMATVKSMVNAHWGHAQKAGADQAQEIEAYRRRLAHVFSTLRWYGPADDFLAPWDGSAPEEPADEPAPPAPGAPRALQWASRAETPDEPSTGHTAPDGLPAEPEHDVDPEPAEAPDFVAQQRDLADEVRRISDELPDGLAARIGAAVKGMHHTTVNRVIAECVELADAFPPTSPIDFRRMGAVYILGSTFLESGEVPAAVVEAEGQAKAT